MVGSEANCVWRCAGGAGSRLRCVLPAANRHSRAAWSLWYASRYANVPPLYSHPVGGHQVPQEPEVCTEGFPEGSCQGQEGGEGGGQQEVVGPGRCRALEVTVGDFHPTFFFFSLLLRYMGCPGGRQGLRQEPTWLFHAVLRPVLVVRAFEQGRAILAVHQGTHSRESVELVEGRPTGSHLHIGLPVAILRDKPHLFVSQSSTFTSCK